MPWIERLGPGGTPRRGTADAAVHTPLIEFISLATHNRFRNLILDALRRDYPRTIRSIRRSANTSMSA